MTCQKCGSGAWAEDNDEIRLPNETWVKCLICAKRWEASGNYAAEVVVAIRKRQACEDRGRDRNVVRCRQCNRPCGADKSMCWWHQSYALHERVREHP